MKTPEKPVKKDTSIDRLKELERATKALIEGDRHLKAGVIRQNEYDHLVGELTEAFGLYQKSKN